MVMRSRNSSVQGMIFAAMIARHVSAAASMRVVHRQQRAARGRARHELEQHFGDDAQRAFAADEEVLHRIAGHVLHAFVAEPGDLAIGQHDRQAHDVVARDAVLQAAQAAGVLRHIAADGADLHRARIGRIKQAVLRRGIVDLLGDDAALRVHREIARVDFEDAIQLHEAEHDAIRRRHAAAAEAGAGAAGDDRDAWCCAASFTQAATSSVVCGNTTQAGRCFERGRAVEAVGNQRPRRFVSTCVLLPSAALERG